ITFLHEDLRDPHLEMRVGDRHVRVARAEPVADPGEKVADGICDDSGSHHQLAFLMPGTSPACASSRKHRRQSAKRRYTARGRPQRLQRVYSRTLNLAFRLKVFS